MDRSREARRSNMTATNGLSRRRQRTSSLQDSHEEEEEMESQDTVRLRDRANNRDKDRDRERERERYRDRDFSNHKSSRKRRRGDSLTLGEEGSTEESLADEEEYEIEERRVAHIISHNSTSYSSSSLSNQNSRKSLPLTRHARPTPPALKAADEMIGVLVPRKARSASVKRSHENWASGNGGFWDERKASTSSRSIEANSPSSSNISARKKMKPSGPRTRLPKVAKSSSSLQQDDIEIEIAEVLFGLMRQSQNSKKEDESVGKPAQKLESKDGVCNTQDTKPSVSVLAQKDSAASDLGGATKKKKVEVDNSSNPSGSTVKFESELSPTKSEICTPKLEKTSQLNVASREASNEIDASKVASVMLEPQEEVAKQGDAKLSIEGSDCPSRLVTQKKSISADMESSATCCKMDSTVTKASSTVLETGSPKVKKFKIDLMVPPTGFSPELDGFNDFASCATNMVQEVTMKSLVKDEEKAERFVKKETAAQEVEERNIEPIEEKSKLKFDLEKPNQDDGRESASKLRLQSQKQEQPAKPGAPKAERTGQSSSVPFQVAVAGWPNGLPPLGYMPPFQTIMSVDGHARSTSTQQPPQFMLSQPRPKRCATHQYIARNIYLNQQFAKMNHLWATGATSNSLIGAKPNSLNVISSTENLIHGNQLQGSFPVANLNSVQDKGQAKTNFPGLTQKDKSSENASLMNPAQTKQLVLQQAPHPAPAGNFLHAPAFIFPVSQQQAAANQSGPSKSTTSARSASFSGNSTAAIPVSSTALPAVAAAMSYNYPNMAANGATYLTIVQNEGFTFPVPTPIGTPPAVRGHPQPMPYFNGSFYSSQIFHPSQLQQQQQPHSQPLIQAAYQNTTVSSASSSSHKQMQSQQLRGGAVNGNLLSSTSMLPNQQQKQHVQPSNQNLKLEPEMSGENAPALGDSRASHNQMNVCGQNFTVPLQPLNFALMPSQIVGGTAGCGNHGEKQQQSHQNSLKGGVELIPSQAFAMSFPSFGGNSSASNLNFSSMTQNPAIFQTLPDMARQGYQVSPTAQPARQKNHQLSEVKAGVGSSNHDDGKKASFGKSPASNGQTLVFDHSATTMNPVTGNWSSHPVTSTTITTNVTAAANPQNFQQQQLLQLHKLQMLQNQQQSAATARSKAPSSSMSSSSIATKLSNNGPMFPQTLVQSNNSSQSTQWKNSTRNPTCQVPPTSLASSNSPTLKNASQQQQVRSPQGHTQITFDTTKSGLAPQGQQIPTSSQSHTTLPVGSSPSAGNLRTSSNGSKACSSIPNLQPQQTENSSSSTGQKNSPVCGRNVPSILSTCPSHLSELKY